MQKAQQSRSKSERRKSWRKSWSSYLTAASPARFCLDPPWTARLTAVLASRVDSKYQ
jgi:hypothetical protein